MQPRSRVGKAVDGTLLQREILRCKEEILAKLTYRVLAKGRPASVVRAPLGDGR